jgi:mono/diheme cytochrome c family protein
VSVTITGADGLTITLTPNEAGNFYSATRLKLPLQATITDQGRARTMAVGQSSGDCNGCHTQAGDSGAPGRIVLP